MNPVELAFLIIGLVIGGLFIYVRFFETNLKDKHK
jgi:uncharacterized protein YneF (UPF0154 family)